jgi:hypothetical protein
MHKTARPKHRHGGFWRLTTAMTVSLALTVQGVAQTLPEPERAAQLALQMQRALTAIEDGLVTMDRSRWDPQAVADALGGDPAALQLWMHSNVVWVPYSGALRGPVGVLMDRRANTLDGALAMAALLTAAGLEVQLASAPLPADAALALVSAPPVELPPVEPPLIVPYPIVAAAELYEIEPAAAYGGLMDADEQVPASLTAWPLLVDQASALAAAGVTPPPRPDVQHLVTDSMSVHWWAQYRGADGWIDADWLTATGASPVIATETILPTALPDAFYQSVTINLMVEQVKGGRANEQSLVEITLRPALGEGQQISLTHMPMDWPADWPNASPDDVQERLRGAFATQDEWWPILTVDGEALGPVSVRADGELNPEPVPSQNPFLPTAIAVAAQALAAADVLRLDDGTASPEELASGAQEQVGEFTAEWLVFTMTAPGEPPRTTRRAIFDLVGPAARASGGADAFVITDAARAVRSLGAMSEVEIGIFGAPPASDYVLFQTGEALLASRPALDQIAADPFGRTPANVGDLLSQVQPGPGALDAFALQRTDINPLGDAVYQDRPLVVAQHAIYARDAATGDFMAQRAIDIVDAGVGVSPFSGHDPFIVRLFQGLADAQAEVEALGGTAVSNAGLSFDPLTGDGWALIRTAAEIPEGLPADLAAMVAAALSEGDIAYVPTSGAALDQGAWWRINPDTGETLAMGPNGWGQALVEWAFLLVLKTLWAQIACMARVAAIKAASQAIDTGRVNLPRTRAELEAGTTDVAKACVREALLNQLTGMTAMIFVGVPRYGMSRLDNWAAGRDGWSAAPNVGQRMPGGVPGGVNPLAQTQAGANPFAQTQAGANPFAQTQPGANPFAQTQPGANPFAQTQPGANPFAQTQPAGDVLGQTLPAPTTGQRPGPSPLSYTLPPGTTPAVAAASAAAYAAEVRATEAYRNYLANPTPANLAARNQSLEDYMTAGSRAVATWDGVSPFPNYGRVNVSAPPSPMPSGAAVPPPAPTGAPQAGGGFASTLMGLGAMGNALGDGLPP